MPRSSTLTQSNAVFRSSFSERLRQRLLTLIYKRGLVNRVWYGGLRLRNATSRRLKVGFGPLLTGENDLAMRKWHIDPIVNAINASPSRYVADIYFAGEDLERFDIVIIVREFDHFTPDTVRRLHQRSALLVYDVADIRYVQTSSGRHDLYTDVDALEQYYKPFVRSMDALILSSPLQRQDFADMAMPQAEIPRPVLNRCHRTSYAHSGPIRLIWQGYPENLAPMRRLHPIVQRLRDNLGVDVRLVLDTNGSPHNDGPIEYSQWSIGRWDRVLAAGDVAVVIKPTDDGYQQRKPSTKVQSFMAAGLPVVCTPSAADRRIISHGINGFFALDDNEWYECLAALVTDTALREKIGTAARRDIMERCRIDRVASQYVELFERLHAPE